MITKTGNRISSLRKNKNLSQEDLAELLNVSRQTISKWETGDTLPDVYNAVAIARVFHITLDELVLGTGSKYGGSSYMAELKEKRRKVNILAIIIGGFGSVTFFTSLVLLQALGADKTTAGIVMVCVMPVLMLCWGFAIWKFISIGRISEEIKYLEKMEMITLTNNLNINNK